MHRLTVLRLLTYALAVALLMAALFALRALPARANELRVCATCTYKDISSANAFARPGDTILVEPGVYTEPYRIYFAHGVTISSTEGAERTILRPGTQNMIFDITGRGAADTPPRTLQGFTLVGHPAQGEIDRGGGIYIANGARPLIVNNIFSDCLATHRGGAICIEEEGTQPTIRGNRFELNAVRGPRALGGGAISVSDAVPIITGNTFIDNYSSNDGGGIYIFRKDPVSPQHALITGNTFIGNSAHDSGGAVYAIDASPLILGNSILSNTANSGAGIYASALTDASLQRNVIAHNTVIGTNELLSFGGGLAIVHSISVTADGNTIQGNRAWKGAGMYIENAPSRAVTVTNNVLSGNGSCELMVRNGSPRVVNNTILGAQGATGSVGIDILGPSSGPALVNNIVVDAGYGIRATQSAAPVLRNNDVWRNSIANYVGVIPGARDVSIDPLLHGAGDFHLQARSPLIDTGLSADAPPQDIDGDPRPLDGDGDGSPVADVGADEYSAASPPTPTATMTRPPTPSPTSGEPPTPTQTRTPTASATPSATETPAATATSTSPTAPTATGTSRPTFTTTPELSLTPTQAVTATPTGIQRCILPVAVWQDEFADPGLSQWWSDWAAGFGGVAESVLSIGTEGTQDRFPLLWSQPPRLAGDWVLEVRFRYGAGNGNDTGFGAGSAPYAGTRYAEGAPAPESLEDILSVRGSATGLSVSALGQLSASRPPGDVAWHVVRVSRQATAIGLSLDGSELGSVGGVDTAVQSIFLGSPVIARAPGLWTTLQLDYVRLSMCGAWGNYRCWLPVIGRAF